MCKLNTANKLYNQMSSWIDELDNGDLSIKEAQVRYNLAKGMTKLQMLKLQQKLNSSKGIKFFND